MKKLPPARKSVGVEGQRPEPAGRYISGGLHSGERYCFVAYRKCSVLGARAI
jgi:hypothetical protein